jgi:hypothetical protein
VSDEHEDMSLSVHEVGHAMVARHNGYTVGKIVVEQFWSSNGFCEVRMTFPETDEEIRDYLVMLMGGVAAQHRWYADIGSSEPDGGEFDRADFATWDCDMTEAEAISRADEILLPEWDELLEVAAEASKRGRLSGSKI